ncbi:MAG TPA: ATP-binding sensor histidine kinase [Labilithrix sp.]|nr:ATP-binding sensor histidine kinase [Labilithrix sp.]
MDFQAVYSVTETLRRDPQAVLLRANRQADGHHVLLKVLSHRASEKRELERFRNELEIGASSVSPHVVHPRKLESLDGSPALELDDPGGKPLEQLLGEPMPIGPFLELACSIANALAELHRDGIIYKNVNPATILVASERSEAWLFDLGLASRIPSEHQSFVPSELIEGSLPYISPEQTGRMNRSIDQRADLYSLGVTFFQMLTGRLPFEAEDPIAWVHSHVARPAPAPSTFVATIPEPLSSLVLRLLAKMPEDRYQTAGGLLADLERFRHMHRAGLGVEPITLGQDDLSDRLQIPQRLYGRASERAKLLGALDRMIDGSAPELCLVSGYSGVGKTSLVHELLRSISGARGFFLSGKFDQLGRSVPYGTIAVAFRAAPGAPLGMPEDRLSVWRGELRQALGSQGRILTEIIPELELIVGPQPPVTPLPPVEAQPRFHAVFGRFLGVLAGKTHPLVLFLDDLQWSDLVSLRLLEYLLLQRETRYVFVVGAYRDNEVDASHPLIATVRRLQSAGSRTTELALLPLAPEHIAELVADAVQLPVEEVRPLSQVVEEKTGGNPFFAIQLLTVLEQERLLRFDPEQRRWIWDLAGICKKGYSDNVVDLVISRIARLPEPSRNSLRLAACVGNSTDLRTLAAISEESVDELRHDLAPALQEGLVLRSGSDIRFLHDRVQQAAYELVPGDQREPIHLRIGRVLLRATPPEQLDEQLFTITTQLNRGQRLLEPSEKNRVAELNLAAGRKAMAASAFGVASSHFETGASLLGPEAWRDRYELAFPLHLGWAQCAFLSGERDAARSVLALLRGRARDTRDVASVAVSEIYLHIVRDEILQAIEVALSCLRTFGIDWRVHPTEEDVRREYEAFRASLGDTPIADLATLPPLKNEEALAITSVIAAVTGAAVYTDRRLLAVITCRSAALCIQFGNSDAAATNYPWLGMVLADVFGHYQDAYDLGRLGRELVDRRGLEAHAARAYLVSAITTQWREPFAGGAALVRRAFDLAVRVGDITYACYVRCEQISLHLAMGTPLDEVRRECALALAYVDKVEYPLVSAVLTSQLRLTLSLQGETSELSSFSGAGFDERSFEAHLEANRRSMTTAICWHYLRKLQASFFAGNWEEALSAARQSEELLWASPSFTEVPEFHFFHALALAAPVRKRPAETQLLEALRAEQERFRIWADGCPENFGHKHALVSAELARIEGRTAEAMPLYEEAIVTARAGSFVQNEAMAYELASEFYRDRGFTPIADLYLREARSRYLAWGAVGKARDIDRRNPQLVEVTVAAPSAILTLPAEQLDWMAVTKAAQAISQEVVWERLVDRLVRVVLEQGGAQRACFVFCRDGTLVIDAEATATELGVEVKSVKTPLSADHAAASIVHLVLRTGEPAAIDDAAEVDSAPSAPYVARRNPRSLLCLPIVRQAQAIAALYLENDLVAGAFPPPRRAALELIASQAAVSIEISQLLSREQERRRAAEEERRCTQLLAEVTAELSESLAVDDQARLLAKVCVGFPATAPLVYLVDESGSLRCRGAASAHPAQEPLVDALRTYAPRVESLDPAVRALRAGSPVLVSLLDDSTLRAWSMNDEHFELLRALGIRSAIAAPLVSRRRTFGVLALTRGGEAPAFETGDLELLSNIAWRAAIAIDNASLYGASQQAVRAREEFLSVASHEMRTPLTSLKLTLHQLQRRLAKMTPSQVDAALARANRQTNRLGHLVDTLLDVTRARSGQLDLCLEDVDLRALVEDVGAQLAQELAHQGTVLELRSEGPIVGRWDELRLEQVVTNLLSNAMRFGTGKPIEVTISQKQGVALLSVTDHGPGIRDEIRPRLFQRFSRGVSASHHGGLGLGLYVSRMIVEAHGGRINVESVCGQGSTFIVELPLARSPASA